MEVYRYQEADDMIICGDFNARLGNLNDCPLDSVPTRICIDQTSNDQGRKLVNFINETRTCVVNGRVSTDNDDYTSVTAHKGQAVVDYFVVRQSDLSHIIDFTVISCLEVANKRKWGEMLNNKCHLPDHNMVVVTIELSSVIREQLLSKNLGGKDVQRQRI